MNHKIRHQLSGNLRRTIQSWLLHTVLLACVYFLVSLLPKPTYICNNNDYGDHKIKVTTSTFVDSSADDLSRKLSPRFNVIDPLDTKIFQMFPVYIHQKKQINSDYNGNTETSQSLPCGACHVKVFHLQNFNFSHFGRTWLNENQDHDLLAQHSVVHSREDGYKRQINPKFVWEQLQKNQKLPDCVRMKVPHDATPTRICVHYERDDNFISNALRDTSTWELELVFQMDEFFRAHPQSQLIDLGCNIGVFTLFAASLAKPALAVDILPSNLALIHLSIAVNDNKLEQNGADDDVKDILNSIGYKKKVRPKYSDLITTVHNAIYSKHAKMFVYLKDDPNLGGTEVKELNIQQSSFNPKDSFRAKMYDTSGNFSEEAIFHQKSQTPDTAANKTLILVDGICLDDLIPFVQTNLSVFLKMDVEGTEPDILLCANNFFMHVDVRVILMEILFHKYSDKGKMMANFLLHHNFLPSEDVAGHKLLDVNPNKMYAWPENMFWINTR